MSQLPRPLSFRRFYSSSGMYISAGPSDILLVGEQLPAKQRFQSAYPDWRVWTVDAFPEQPGSVDWVRDICQSSALRELGR